MCIDQKAGVISECFSTVPLRVINSSMQENSIKGVDRYGRNEISSIVVAIEDERERRVNA